MVVSSTTVTYQPADPRLGRHVEHDADLKVLLANQGDGIVLHGVGLP